MPGLGYALMRNYGKGGLLTKLFISRESTTAVTTLPVTIPS